MNFSTMAYEKRKQTDTFLRKFGDEAHIYLVTGSFGDVLLTLSLFVSSEISSEKNVVLLITEEYEQLARKLCAKKIRYEILTQHGLEHFLTMIIYCQDRCNVSESGLKIAIPSGHRNIEELIARRALTEYDARLYILGIESRLKALAYPFDYGSVNVMHEFLLSNDLKPGKTLIFCPNNNTNVGMHEDYFSEIVRLVSSKGWGAVTNIFPTAQNKIPTALPGTTPISIPNHSSVEIIEACGGLIGGVNGMITIAGFFCKKARVACIWHEGQLTVESSKRQEVPLELQDAYPGVDLCSGYKTFDSKDMAEIISHFP